MTDLDRRLRSLDLVDTPDLWDDIEARARLVPAPTLETPQLVTRRPLLVVVGALLIVLIAIGGVALLAIFTEEEPLIEEPIATTAPTVVPTTIAPSTVPSIQVTPTPTPSFQALPAPVAPLPAASITDLEWERVPLTGPREGWGGGYEDLGTLGGKIFRWSPHEDGAEIVSSRDGLSWEPVGVLPFHPLKAGATGGRLFALQDEFVFSPEGDLLGHELAVWTSNDGGTWVSSELPTVVGEPAGEVVTHIVEVAGRDRLVALGTLRLQPNALISHLGLEIPAPVRSYIYEGRVELHCVDEFNVFTADTTPCRTEDGLGFLIDVEPMPGGLQIRYTSEVSGEIVAQAQVRLPASDLGTVAQLLETYGQVPLIWTIAPSSEGTLVAVGPFGAAHDVPHVAALAERFLVITEVIGEGGERSEGITVWQSETGSEWHQVQPPFIGREGAGVFTARGRAVAFVEEASGRPVSWTTTDGTNWERIPEFDAAVITVGDLGWVAVQDESNLWFSADGAEWDRLSRLVKQPVDDSSWNPEVAIGADTIVIWGGSGENWQDTWFWIGSVP